MSAAANSASSFRGWIQSTGQTSTQAVSFVPTQGSQMMYAILVIMIAQGCDPALTALFTPRHPRVGRYEVCTTTDPLDEVAAGVYGPRYGPSELLEPLDAFGAAGAYNRGALTRLYAGKRVRVARGW